jgi:hypothetical protein
MHTTNLSIAKQYELLEQTINALEEQNAILKSILEAAGDPPPPRWEYRRDLRYWGVEPRYSTRDSSKFRGYVRRTTPESVGKNNLRAPPPATNTYRPGFRPPVTPKIPFGRAGALGLAGAIGYGAGTAIDQILHGRPGVPKDQLRPVPTELLPPPIPQMSPTNNQGGGGFKGYSPPGGGVGGGGGIGG